MIVCLFVCFFNFFVESNITSLMYVIEFIVNLFLFLAVPRDMNTDRFN